MTDHPTNLALQIRKEAARLGFAALGFAAPTPQPVAIKRVTAMIEEHRNGEMHYLETNMAERTNPALLLPNVQTIISTAISYNYPIEYHDGFPKISRYALIEDYHTVMRTKLEKLLAAIKRIMGEPLAAFIAVDSSPLLEKNWAEVAGIGKTGKNTLLKVPSAGSYIFLGEILLDREIRSTPLMLPNYCGSCQACLESCPTGALIAPGKIDASRCISYLTIELKREFTPDEAAMIGEWLFGCDLCQEACPYNQQASISAHELFTIRQELLNLSTEEIFNLTKSSFRKLFYGTPIFRIGLRRLKRNAQAVEENLKKNGDDLTRETSGKVTLK